MTRGAPVAYSINEMRWLEANRMMIITDYHRAFQTEFARADVSAKNLHALRKRMGWKVGRSKGRFAGRSLLFSRDEIAWLGENCTMEIGEWHAAFVEKFGRTDISTGQLVTLRKNRKWKTGRTGQFEPGIVPHNKGKPCPPGTGGRHPNSQRHQFKSGQLPHNTKHAGAEYVDAQSGHVYVSINETNPRTGFERRYVQKHRLLWEKANGPIPDGMVLKCLSDDKADCDPSNWELIPRSLIPLLGGRSRHPFDHAPSELKPTIMAVAKLKHRIRETSR